jgi:hypothetical protein
MVSVVEIWDEKTKMAEMIRLVTYLTTALKAGENVIPEVALTDIVTTVFEGISVGEGVREIREEPYEHLRHRIVLAMLASATLVQRSVAEASAALGEDPSQTLQRIALAIEREVTD